MGVGEGTAVLEETVLGAEIGEGEDIDDGEGEGADEVADGGGGRGDLGRSSTRRQAEAEEKRVVTWKSSSSRAMAVKSEDSSMGTLRWTSSESRAFLGRTREKEARGEELEVGGSAAGTRGGSGALAAEVGLSRGSREGYGEQGGEGDSALEAEHGEGSLG